MVSSPQAKGGSARRDALSKADRSSIAKQAAEARWHEPAPKALFGEMDKPIRIANIEVPCFVLEDGRRVIHLTGMTDALKIARGGSMKRGLNRLELFCSGKLIKPFISNELYERVQKPIRFRIGRNTAYGFTSDTLIDVAEAVISLENSGNLQTQQVTIAIQCRIITSALTRIGLVALIDEATGYQDKRSSDELQRILEAYILPEHRPWSWVVPPEFIKELHRVYGWPYSADNRGPRYAGKLIRQLIYERLPSPVLPALDEKNPTNGRYQRKLRHHQLLTEKLGLDHFKNQLISITTLLRATPDGNPRVFKDLVERVFGQQRRLDLEGGA
ncbi:P63C domain-containing protein [Roseomonas gilardii]|uniref:P63C domain-containing protein n=1 Tax=Roseomonas gilardii TaxID=257708 RepID=A0ABU3MJ28_9PROT|nr:P63C domain-containing protein [Roseomonas gilardii]MDT8333023.1 P63C domain-containing protein [Roseomonas gilardii]